MQPRNIIATYALIYANGPVHLGHMLGYVQTDIWVRFQKMRGHQCHYVCGSDAHGTPIMLKAEEQGMAPAEMVRQISQQQLQDFKDFGVAFDSFELTDTETNQSIVETAYHQLEKNGDIETRDIEQAYDEDKSMFLPDRYVRGECPKCGAADQYGDSCEVCGATYAPTELKHPISTVSGKPPIRKTSTHYFFKLTHYAEPVKTWANAGHTQSSVANKLNEWFEQGLQDWDISRDAPYFGFEIPNTPNKYFYVWLDAPMGYISSFQTLAKTHNLDSHEYWREDNNTELYHFIGKDITYFHTLFWPALLLACGYRLPTGVYTHGFLTINGRKMSKSRGTFITARQYLDQLNPEHMRYYYAAKLGSGIEDIDLNLEDFRLRVNSDLVGKLVNIASRCAGFIRKLADNILSESLLDQALFEEFSAQAKPIAELYENREFAQAMRVIMELADKANQFIETYKPWELAKQEGQEAQVHLVCSQGINLFRLLMVYLKPVLPATVKKVEAFLNIEALSWEDASYPLAHHQINKFKPLLMRVEEDQTSALLSASTA